MSPPAPPPDGGYRALHDAAGARVVARDVLSVVGPEALTYLQGQCSQDLVPLDVGATVESLVLSPQGKVDGWVRVTRTGEDAFALDADPGCGPAVRTRLERFTLRTEVTIGSLDWACLSIRGPDAAGGRPTGVELALPVDAPGWRGVDLLGPAPSGDPDLVSWAPDGVVWCDEQAWEAVRIEAGVPMGGREVTGSTIAAEADLVDRTVSFTKGCFTGQELVARLDSRGAKVARRLCGLVVPGVEGVAGPVVGSTVWTADGQHEVGVLTSAAWSPGHGATVALATLHRRVTPPEQVEVRWGDGAAERRTPAEARPLPLGAGG